MMMEGGGGEGGGDRAAHSDQLIEAGKRQGLEMDC